MYDSREPVGVSVIGSTVRMPAALSRSISASMSSTSNPKCSSPSRFSSATARSSDDPGGLDDTLSRHCPPISMPMVMVLGITVRSDTILALKCCSYHAAVA